MLVVALGLDFPGFFEGVEVWRKIDLLAVQDVFDGEYLQTRIIFVPAGRLAIVESALLRICELGFPR